MSEMKIRISTDNAAFQEFGLPELEVARILRELAEALETGLLEAYGKAQNLHDINGNPVGTAKFYPGDQLQVVHVQADFTGTGGNEEDPDQFQTD